MRIYPHEPLFQTLLNELGFNLNFKVPCLTLSEECVQDIEIRNRRLNQIVTSEATEEEIQDWAETMKNLDILFQPEVYEKARRKLQFLEYDWEKDRDVPTNKPRGSLFMPELFWHTDT